jgi:hypothetical protein
LNIELKKKGVVVEQWVLKGNVGSATTSGSHALTEEQIQAIEKEERETTAQDTIATDLNAMHIDENISSEGEF